MCYYATLLLSIYITTYNMKSLKYYVINEVKDKDGNEWSHKDALQQVTSDISLFLREGNPSYIKSIKENYEWLIQLFPNSKDLRDIIDDEYENELDFATRELSGKWELLKKKLDL